MDADMDEPGVWRGQKRWRTAGFVGSGVGRAGRHDGAAITAGLRDPTIEETALIPQTGSPRCRAR